MKRGWILSWSVLAELMVFTVVHLALRLFSVLTAWRLLIISSEVAGMIVLGFCLIYFWWAPNNLFFTFVKEGTAKIVVRGDAIRKVLIQWKKHTIKTETRASVPSTLDGEADVGDVIDDIKDEASTPLLGGFRLYGIWPFDDIYIYPFGWTNVTESGEIQKHPKEWLDYVLLKDDVYWAQVKAAEDQKLLPLDVGLVLRLRVKNPYKALFCVQNWLETIINMVEPAVRDVITSDTYENWIQKEKDLGSYVFRRLQGMVLVNNQWEKQEKDMITELRELYGIEMVSFGVKGIDPTPIETLTGVRAATLKKYLAEQEKKRIETEAMAEANKVKILAKAEQNRLGLVYAKVAKFGDLGKLIRALETLEKSPGQGVKWVIPIPGMADFLASAFPRREINSLQAGEIKKLREAIGRLSPPQPSSI